MQVQIHESRHVHFSMPKQTEIYVAFKAQTDHLCIDNITFQYERLYSLLQNKQMKPQSVLLVTPKKVLGFNSSALQVGIPGHHKVVGYNLTCQMNMHPVAFAYATTAYMLS